MKAVIKKELKRLEKYSSSENPTPCILLGEFDYTDKVAMALPLFGTWKGKFKEYAKKEVAVKEPMGAIGTAYFAGLDDTGKKIIQINLAKGKGKNKVAKIERPLKKLIPPAAYQVILGDIDEAAMEALEQKMDAAPEDRIYIQCYPNPWADPSGPELATHLLPLYQYMNDIEQSRL